MIIATLITIPTTTTTLLLLLLLLLLYYYSTTTTYNDGNDDVATNKDKLDLYILTCNDVSNVVIKASCRRISKIGSDFR